MRLVLLSERHAASKPTVGVEELQALHDQYEASLVGSLSETTARLVELEREEKAGKDVGKERQVQQNWKSILEAYIKSDEPIFVTKGADDEFRVAPRRGGMCGSRKT